MKIFKASVKYFNNDIINIYMLPIEIINIIPPDSYEDSDDIDIKCRILTKDYRFWKCTEDLEVIIKRWEDCFNL